MGQGKSGFLEGRNLGYCKGLLLEKFCWGGNKKEKRARRVQGDCQASGGPDELCTAWSGYQAKKAYIRRMSDVSRTGPQSLSYSQRLFFATRLQSDFDFHCCMQRQSLDAPMSTMPVVYVQS